MKQACLFLFMMDDMSCNAFEHSILFSGTTWSISLFLGCVGFVVDACVCVVCVLFVCVCVCVRVTYAVFFVQYLLLSLTRLSKDMHVSLCVCVRVTLTD